jgi:hypothetical protein
MGSVCCQLMTCNASCDLSIVGKQQPFFIQFQRVTTVTTAQKIHFNQVVRCSSYMAKVTGYAVKSYS